MDSELLTWMCLAGGVLLMLAEVMLPGGVAFFLGFGGVLVAALRFLGVLNDPVTSITTWLLSSLALVVAIRPLFMKYFGGESSYKTTDEDFEAMDEVVDVVETVNELDNSGRIRYQGATWQAMSIDGTIPKGAKAVIKYRDNVTWIIEAIDGSEPTDTEWNRDPSGDWEDDRSTDSSGKKTRKERT